MVPPVFNPELWLAITNLAELALPPQQGGYHFLRKTPNQFFAVGGHQAAVIQAMKWRWSEAMKAGMLGLNVDQAAQIVQWLTQKQTALEQALAQRRALYFDVLVLGLVSGAPALHPSLFFSS